MVVASYGVTGPLVEHFVAAAGLVVFAGLPFAELVGQDRCSKLDLVRAYQVDLASVLVVQRYSGPYPAASGDCWAWLLGSFVVVSRGA